MLFGGFGGFIVFIKITPRLFSTETGMEKKNLLWGDRLSGKGVHGLGGFIQWGTLGSTSEAMCFYSFFTFGPPYGGPYRKKICGDNETTQLACGGIRGTILSRFVL